VCVCFGGIFLKFRPGYYAFWACAVKFYPDFRIFEVFDEVFRPGFSPRFSTTRFAGPKFTKKLGF
jgi:hypothetical protein